MYRPILYCTCSWTGLLCHGYMSSRAACRQPNRLTDAH